MTISDLINLQKEYNGIIEFISPAYDQAVDIIKDGLKHPATSIFPVLSLDATDTLEVTFNKDSNEVTFKGVYYAKNSYGNYIEGEFNEDFLLDSTKKNWLIDEREWLFILYDFQFDDPRKVVLDNLKESKCTIKELPSEDNFDIYLVTDSDILFFVEVEQLKIYFEKDKLKKLIFKVPRGDEAIETWNYLIKNGSFKEIGDEKYAYEYENALVSSAKSTFSSACFVIDIK